MDGETKAQTAGRVPRPPLQSASWANRPGWEGDPWLACSQCSLGGQAGSRLIHWLLGSWPGRRQFLLGKFHSLVCSLLTLAALGPTVPTTTTPTYPEASGWTAGSVLCSYAEDPTSKPTDMTSELGAEGSEFCFSIALLLPRPPLLLHLSLSQWLTCPGSQRSGGPNVSKPHWAAD